MDNSMGFDLKDKSAHISSLNKTPATIVQEYAVKRRLAPQYDLIYNGMSQTKVTFKYSVTLENYMAVGEGTSKKEAKHVASLNLLKLMIEDKPYLLETEFKHWDFNKYAVSPFENNIKVNAVGRLNDMCLQSKLGVPEFVLVREEGQAHAKLFTIDCYVAKMIETATHKTKKQAKHIAAVQMIKRLMSIERSMENESDSTVPSPDSYEVLEQVANVKPENVKKYPPIDENIRNYHLIFKKMDWPNTNTLEALVLQYLSNNNDLNIDDPLSILNIIIKESEMKLTVNFMDRDVNVESVNVCCMMSIDNIYPPIYGVGLGGDEESANKQAALKLLKNMCILYI